MSLFYSLRSARLKLNTPAGFRVSRPSFITIPFHVANIVSAVVQLDAKPADSAQRGALNGRGQLKFPQVGPNAASDGPRGPQDLLVSGSDQTTALPADTNGFG